MITKSVRVAITSSTVEFLQWFQAFLNFCLPNFLLAVVVFEEFLMQGITGEDQLLQGVQFSLEQIVMRAFVDVVGLTSF